MDKCDVISFAHHLPEKTSPKQTVLHVLPIHARTVVSHTKVRLRLLKVSGEGRAERIAEFRYLNGALCRERFLEMIDKGFSDKYISPDLRVANFRRVETEEL